LNANSQPRKLNTLLTSRLWLCNTGAPVPIDIEVELQNLERHLQEIGKADVLKGKTRAFKSRLNDFVPRILTERSATINPELSGKVPANLRLDRILANIDGSQSMNVELCFNNRETAGTNLLKLSTASAFQTISSAAYSLGILIVPTRELLDFGGWDPAYGDSVEYSYYFKTAFGRTLSANLLVLELSNSY
jgi:hypothetical protein